MSTPRTERRSSARRPAFPLAPVSLALALAAASSAQAAPPTEPGGLRAQVYSSTAIELFWRRSTDPDGAVRAYEVRRDGELLVTRDALSLFVEGLAPDTDALFTVTAIDFDGERSDAAEVRVSTVAGGGSGPGPNVPADLRAEVYGATNAELFWSRAAEPGLSYEVSVGDELVGTTDGTSFYLPDLMARTQYVYDVVAIDTEGRRSGVASVPFSTGGRIGRPVGEGGVPAPANARLDVYSSTAAELFWDRPPSGAAIRRTEVRRDGTLIGQTDGTSFFDDGREPGRSYRYELIAFAADTLRSAATVVDETGAGSPPPSDPRFLSPIVDDWNAGQLVLEAFSVLSGRAFAQDVIDLPGPVTAVADDETVDLVCDNGGTARIGSTVSGERVVTRALDVAFDDCQLDATVYDGELERRASGSFVTLVSSGLERDAPGVDVAFAGTFDRQYAATPDGGPQRTFAADVDRFTRTDVDGTFSIENASIDYELSLPFRASLEGRFDYSSALTQRRTVEVRILEPFLLENTSEALEDGTARQFPFFDGGRIEIRAEDGSAVTAVVDAGGFTADLILSGPFAEGSPFQGGLSLGSLEEVATPFEPRNLFPD